MPTEQEHIETLKRQLRDALETADQLNQLRHQPNLEIRWPFLFTSMHTGAEEAAVMLEQVKALDHVKDARIDDGDRTTQIFWVSVDEKLFKELYDQISAIVYKNMPPPANNDSSGASH